MNDLVVLLDYPRPPLAVTADKAYDSEKVRQQIKDEGALPVRAPTNPSTQHVDYRHKANSYDNPHNENR
jgi:hypothetical protein